MALPGKGCGCISTGKPQSRIGSFATSGGFVATRFHLRFGISHTPRRHFVDAFFSQGLTRLPGLAAWRVLDLGGHKTIKRGSFDLRQFADDIVVLNVVADKGTDVCGDAAAQPFADDCFDLVVCGEVLEHIADPRPVLSEIRRVLKPGGMVLMTVPFLYPIHADPYDFGRYTGSFWQAELTKAGLELTSLERQGGYFAVLATLLQLGLNNLTRSAHPTRLLTRLRRRGLALVGEVVCRGLLAIDRRHVGGAFCCRFPGGYGVVGTKPAIGDER